MKRTNKKGFTIVELVIVIAVIAILATVLVPTFTGVIADATDAAFNADAKAKYTQYIADATKADAQADIIIEASVNGDAKYYAVVDGAFDADNQKDTIDECLEEYFGSEATYGTPADGIYVVTVTTTNP